MMCLTIILDLMETDDEYYLMAWQQICYTSLSLLVNADENQVFFRLPRQVYALERRTGFEDYVL